MAGYTKAQRDDIIAKDVSSKLKVPAKTVRAIIAAIDAARESVDLRSVEQNKRIRRVDELVRQGWSTRQIVNAIVDEFDVNIRTAYEDRLEAEARRVPELAIEAKTLQERAAYKFERLQYTAESKGDIAAAISAADKWAKVTGAYAARKIEITGSVGVSVSMKIEAIVGVLDADGLAALDVIHRQVRAAREAGLLTDAVAQESTKEKP
jgi:hypothetical protein